MGNNVKRVVSLGLVTVLGGGVASAGPFVQLDRQDGSSSVGAEILYSNLDTTGGSDVTLLRLDGHFQYVKPSGVGVYGTVPVAYASGDADTITSVGNIELGGIYNIKTALDANVVLHGGLLLPTASDAVDDFFVGIASSELRIHDLYQWLPEGTSLRLAASPQLRSGQIFLRADLGVDINLDNAGDDTVDPAFHVNAGVGFFASPEVALTAEVTSLTIFNDNTDDDNITNLAVGARYLGTVAPYLGIVVSLDEQVRDDLPFGVVLGADARL